MFRSPGLSQHGGFSITPGGRLIAVLRALLGQLWIRYMPNKVRSGFAPWQIGNNTVWPSRLTGCSLWVWGYVAFSCQKRVVAIGLAVARPEITWFLTMLLCRRSDRSGTHFICANCIHNWMTLNRSPWFIIIAGVPLTLAGGF